MSENSITFSKASHALKQSAIRSASVRCEKIKGVNLGQGVCDIATDLRIKHAAMDAILNNRNTYASLNGLAPLREALTHKIKKFNKIDVNPSQILVSHGSTGSYICALKALFNPGDEVILFEPFYGYHKFILELEGMKVNAIEIDPATGTIDFDKLEKSISKNTKGMVICTPCNPSGKVFTKDELIKLGDLANQHNLLIITDEIYEYITYPGFEHISIASLNDFGKRTITISGFSKTYNVTGWRLGYAYGPENIIEKMALLHDLIYVCPPTPLQYGMIEALNLPDSFYDEMRSEFLDKKDIVVSALRDMKFKLKDPEGAYYLMVDFRELDFENDKQLVDHLLEHAKVASVPGSSFYHDPKKGEHLIRICFALDESKLQLAMQQLKQIF